MNNPNAEPTDRSAQAAREAEHILDERPSTAARLAILRAAEEQARSMLRDAQVAADQAPLRQLPGRARARSPGWLGWLGWLAMDRPSLAALTVAGVAAVAFTVTRGPTRPPSPQPTSPQPTVAMTADAEQSRVAAPAPTVMIPVRPSVVADATLPPPVGAALSASRSAGAQSLRRDRVPPAPENPQELVLAAPPSAPAPFPSTPAHGMAGPAADLPSDRTLNLSASAEPASPPVSSTKDDKPETFERPSVSAAGAMSSDVATAKSQASEPPDTWLRRIAELRSASRDTEADQQLAAFLKQYPGYHIPESLRRRPAEH